MKLEVPLIVVIGARLMPVKDVMNLAPGAIVELPKLADEDLEILVNNKRIGAGSAVKVGENFGIKVSYVGNLKDRIAALGGQAKPTDNGQPATAPPADVAGASSPAPVEAATATAA